MDTDEMTSKATGSAVEGDAVCAVLLKFLETQPEVDGRREWRGHAEALRKLLVPHAPAQAERSVWLRDPVDLATRLRTVAAKLASAGVSIGRSRDENRRTLSIVWTPVVPVPLSDSPAAVED